MAKKGSHYVKKSTKKYLTQKDIRMLIICAAAVVIVVAAFFMITALTDDKLELKDGKVVGVGDNWIIANAASGGETVYYKYGEYDFAGYDGEVVPGNVSYDDNATCVQLYPADDRYDEGYVYASSKEAHAVVENVSSQIGYMLTDGEVHEPEEFMDGYIYWYTTTETNEDSDEVKYAQVFSAYLPADHNGTVIVRVTYRFDTPDEYVTAETGYAEAEAIAKYITLE